MCPNLPDVRIYPTLPYLSRLANNERKRHTFLFEDIEHKKHQALPYLADHYKRAFGQGVKYGDEIKKNICFCGRVPWLYQYWPGGFMLFVVLCPGTPEGSTGSGSGFKASQKTGQRLKVSSGRLGEAENIMQSHKCGYIL